MAEVNSWASRDSVSYARGGGHPPESPGPARPAGEIRNRASPTSCTQADAHGGRLPRPAAGDAAARSEIAAAGRLAPDCSPRGHRGLRSPGSRNRPPAAGPPRRVLLVIDSLSGGGAERHVADLAIALRSRGWDVEVACSVAGVQAAPLRASDVPVSVLAGSLVERRLSLRYVRALRRLLVQGRYDVGHAHLYASAAAAAAAAPRHPPPLLPAHTARPCPP